MTWLLKMIRRADLSSLMEELYYFHIIARRKHASTDGQEASQLS